MSTALSRLFSRTSAAALACLALAAVTFVFVQTSRAGAPVTFTVTTSVDAIDNNLNDGVCGATVNPRPQGEQVNACTLRAAIMQANHNLENDPGSGPFTIQLGTDTYDLTIVNDGTHDDASLRGDLDIAHGMTIQGNGSANSIVDASHLNCETTDRAFHVFAPFNEAVSFTGFAIQNGHAYGNVAQTPPFCPNGDRRRARPTVGAFGNLPFGGGILNEADLTLTGMAVQHNEAGEGGGGIYSTGAVTVTGSLIWDNLVGTCGNTFFRSNGRTVGVNNNHVGGGIGSTGALDINGESVIVENEVRGRSGTNGFPGGRAGGSSDIGAQGGGVYHAKLGVMSNTLVEDNHAYILNCQARRARGQRTTGFSNSSQAQGGGIYNNAVLTLTNVLVGQEALNQKGFSGNTAGRGGGIYNNAGGSQQETGGAAVGVTMVDSTVQGNFAGLSGGGIHNNGFLDSNNSDIIANQVVGSFFLNSGTPRATGISSSAGGGLFNEGDAVVQNDSLVGDPAPGGLDFIGNSAAFGGGIFNSFFADLVVTSSNVDGNLAGRGGGIFNQGTADVVDDSTVSFNLAESFQFPSKAPNGRAAGSSGTVGGGIYNESDIRTTRSSGENGIAQFFIEESTLEGNVAESGGGIANDGSMHISKSTVHHNAARQEEQNGCQQCERPNPRAQGFPPAVGGGMLHTGSAVVENSTFSANTAENDGGGIFVDFGSLDLIHVTLADNSVDLQPASGAGDGPPGGGLVDFSGDTSNYQATLFANNIPANCAGFSGALNSQGQNLADDESCFLDDPGDFAVVTDALLGALADNGGPTLTHNPDSGSPAVDRITGECSESDDQRSVSRPQGTGCDVGAVERGGGGEQSPSPPPPIATPTGPPAPTPSPSPSPSPTPEPECPGYEGDPRNDVVGTPEPDVLDGTPFDDIICGFEGDDILRGFFGNDLLLAGPDDDRTFGGPGDDKIRNSTGNDDSFGGDGDDEVRGGRGEDDIDGGFGNDLLRGYENDDSVTGGPGNDRVLGFPGDDDLDGGDGNDFVKGGLGNDDLNGGPDNDNCKGGKGQDTVQNCEQGSPRAVADRRSGV